MSPCLKMTKPKQDVMVHSCNANTQKTEAWGSPQVEGQPIEPSSSGSAMTYNETMSQNTTRTKFKLKNK